MLTHRRLVRSRPRRQQQLHHGLQVRVFFFYVRTLCPPEFCYFNSSLPSFWTYETSLEASDPMIIPNSIHEEENLTCERPAWRISIHSVSTLATRLWSLLLRLCQMRSIICFALPPSKSSVTWVSLASVTYSMLFSLMDSTTESLRSTVSKT